MNELLFGIVMLSSIGLVLAAAAWGLAGLQCCAVALALTTSIIAGKVVPLFGLTASAGTCCYAAIFLCTDLVAECYGRRNALKTVLLCLIGNAAFLCIGFCAVGMVGDNTSPVNSALDALFAFLPRLILGGLLAFAVSQLFDVWLFDALKRKTAGRHLWLRNCASTMASQAIDTVIVWHVAFYGEVQDLWSIIFVSYAVKVVVALCDTPFCYLGRSLTPEARRDRSEVRHDLQTHQS